MAIKKVTNVENKKEPNIKSYCQKEDFDYQRQMIKNIYSSLSEIAQIDMLNLANARFYYPLMEEYQTLKFFKDEMNKKDGDPIEIEDKTYFSDEIEKIIGYTFYLKNKELNQQLEDFKKNKNKLQEYEDFFKFNVFSNDDQPICIKVTKQDNEQFKKLCKNIGIGSTSTAINMLIRNCLNTKSILGIKPSDDF